MGSEGQRRQMGTYFEKKFLMQVLLAVLNLMQLTRSQRIKLFEIQDRSHHPGPGYGLQGSSNLCAATYCSRGSVCRAVQTCSTCPLEAVCVSPRRIPYNVDQFCQERGYSTGVLLDGPFSTQLKPSRCGGGIHGHVGSYCPRGSNCEFVTHDKGRCCLSASAGYGWPYTRGSRQQGINSRCGYCPQGTRCQRVPIQCIRAPCDQFVFHCVGPQRYDLSCPTVSRRYCDRQYQYDQCRTDYDCSGYQRCCFDGCQRRCQRLINY